MYCGKCGKKNDDSSNFCKYCGSSMSMKSEDFSDIGNIQETKRNNKARKATKSRRNEQANTGKGKKRIKKRYILLAVILGWILISVILGSNETTSDMIIDDCETDSGKILGKDIMLDELEDNIGAYILFDGLLVTGTDNKEYIFAYYGEGESEASAFFLARDKEHDYLSYLEEKDDNSDVWATIKGEVREVTIADGTPQIKIDVHDYIEKSVENEKKSSENDKKSESQETVEEPIQLVDSNLTYEFLTDAKNGLLYYNAKNQITDKNGTVIPEYTGYYVTDTGYVSDGEVCGEGLCAENGMIGYRIPGSYDQEEYPSDISVYYGELSISGYYKDYYAVDDNCSSSDVYTSETGSLIMNLFLDYEISGYGDALYKGTITPVDGNLYKFTSDDGSTQFWINFYSENDFTKIDVFAGSEWLDTLRLESTL